MDNSIDVDLVVELKQQDSLSKNIVIEGGNTYSDYWSYGKFVKFIYNGNARSLNSEIKTFNDHIKSQLEHKGYSEIGATGSPISDYPGHLSMIDRRYHGDRKSIRVMIVVTHVSSDKYRVHIDLTQRSDQEG